MFVFIALASFFWLLYKSGTKPSRIVYPCQRAAAANVGSFAILFPFLYVKKIKKFFKNTGKLFSHESSNELAILSNDDLVETRDYFSQLSDIYVGKLKNITAAF